MLRPSAHSVACCCVLLGDVAQSLKPVKLWANNSQHLFWSVIAEVYNGPFAQLFQQCWGHARELQMVYEVFWVKSFPRYNAGPNNHPFAHHCQHGRNNSQHYLLAHCWPNFIVIRSRVYNEPIQRPAPSWLVSVIGRALHRYRRGQGFESRTSLAFSSQLQKLRI